MENNYRELFDKIKAPEGLDEKIISKALSSSKKPVRRTRLFAAAAAAACIVVAISATALAKDWFGLRGLEITDEGGSPVVETPYIGEEEDVTHYRPALTGTISLQGFADREENKAVTEWQNFLAHYDDGGALARIGNSPTGFEEKYGQYLVYTQEMADKLDEITAKYGLRLHDNFVSIPDNSALADMVGGSFWGDSTVYSAYAYTDGTFQFDGEHAFAGVGTVGLQFRRTMRGVFDDVTLNVGDIGSYREWEHKTESGVTVLLALGADKSLIIADLDDAFVAVNVLAGEDTALTDNGDGTIPEGNYFNADLLEQLADNFDFSVL